MISNGIPNNKHQLGLGCGIGFSSLLLFQLSRILHRKNGMYLQLSEDSRIYGHFNHKKHMVIQSTIHFGGTVPHFQTHPNMPMFKLRWPEHDFPWLEPYDFKCWQKRLSARWPPVAGCSPSWYCRWPLASWSHPRICAEISQRLVLWTSRLAKYREMHQKSNSTNPEINKGLDIIHNIHIYI